MDDVWRVFVGNLHEGASGKLCAAQEPSTEPVATASGSLWGIQPHWFGSDPEIQNF